MLRSPRLNFRLREPRRGETVNQCIQFVEQGRPRLARVVRVGICLLCCVSVNALADERIEVEKARREAQQAHRAGDYAKAERLYRDVLTVEPSDHVSRLQLSWMLIKQGQLERAYQEATSVINQGIINARARALVGVALLRMGFFQESVQELNAALALDPREPLTLAGMAEIDFFENRSESAYERLRLATSVEPREPDFWIAFGRTAARLERFKEAAEYYQRFLVVSPKLEEEKRARYRGLIDFYFALSRSQVSRLHQVDGPRSVSVPFVLDNSRPYVRVRINGHDTPLMFVVDTGASITVMSEATARRLNVNPMARGGHARAVGGGGTFPIVYGLIHRLEIGEMKVYNVPIYIRQFRHFAESGKKDEPRVTVDGFLGLSVLSNFRLTLDYAQREMIVERPGTLDFLENLPADVSVIPFRTTNGGLMSALVQLEEHSGYHFLIDSGASATVLCDDVIEKLNWKSKLLPDLKVRVLGAAGTIEEVALMVIPSFRVHDLEQRNVRAPILNLAAINETAGFFQAGIIGGSFLRHFRVTFDFQRGRLLMRPQTEAVRRITPTAEANPVEKPSEN